jgi:hypothetical protein
MRSEDVVIAQVSPAPEIVAAQEEVIQAAVTERTEIESAAAVEIAEIHAETDVAAIEAAAKVATAVTREELEQCQSSIRTMEGTLATISSQVQLISETLVETEAEEPPSPTESPENVSGDPPAARTPEAESPPEPVKKKPAIRWT